MIVETVVAERDGDAFIGEVPEPCPMVIICRVVPLQRSSLGRLFCFPEHCHARGIVFDARHPAWHDARWIESLIQGIVAEGHPSIAA